jgi:hypothetical protein
MEGGVSMKPTCQLRRLMFPGKPSSIWNGEYWVPEVMPAPRLQQLWVDEADVRIQEWRDVPLVDESKSEVKA